LPDVRSRGLRLCNANDEGTNCRPSDHIRYTPRGIEDQAASLEPGKLADIVTVPADPMADIQELERVNFVMKDGQVFRQS
jgi:hypothetical protein